MDFINRYGLNGGGATITAAQITAYMGSNEVAKTTAELGLKDIMLQKYISQWGWAGMEQWSDMRKYHYQAEIYPYFTQLTAAELYEANNGKYAYRLRPRYSSEFTWNKSELAKWGGLKTDYHTLETWSNLP